MRPGTEGEKGMNSDPASATPIRVLLVDDHQTMLWGLQRLIESAGPRMQLAGMARSVAEMLAKAAAAKPDCIVLDIDLGGCDATEAIAALQQMCTGQVLVLTGSRELGDHSKAILRGARGIVFKDEPAETILRAIERITAGDIWVSRHLMGQVLGSIGKRDAKPDDDLMEQLTPRERDIVAAVIRHSGAKGLVVAETLGISERTLRNQLSTIYSKLHVRNRLELYAYATRHGMAEHG